MSRQQRRAEERARNKAVIRDRVTERVIQAHSIESMWSTFREEILERHGIGKDLPEAAPAVRLIRHAFFAGAASVFDLVTRVAPDAVSEDEGVLMLDRLAEELTAHAAALSASKR